MAASGARSVDIYPPDGCGLTCYVLQHGESWRERGRCFRNHVLEVCPEFARFTSDTQGIRKSFEVSSLETINLKA